MSDLTAMMLGCDMHYKNWKGAIEVSSTSYLSICVVFVS